MTRTLRFERPLIGVTENNTFIIAAVAEPYFCFEAATEEEAVSLAKRALAFWTQNRDHAKAQPSRSRQKSVTLLRPFRRVEEDELL